MTRAQRPSDVPTLGQPSFLVSGTVSGGGHHPYLRAEGEVKVTQTRSLRHVGLQELSSEIDLRPPIALQLSPAPSPPPGLAPERSFGKLVKRRAQEQEGTEVKEPRRGFLIKN